MNGVKKRKRGRGKGQASQKEELWKCSLVQRIYTPLSTTFEDTQGGFQNKNTVIDKTVNIKNN